MNKRITKANIFIDMDGVLAEHHPDVEELMYDEGFFLNRPCDENALELVERLNELDGCEVYILSSILDSPYVIEEKNAWLDKYLPRIRVQQRHYVPRFEKKSDYVRNTFANLDDSHNILLDDFTKNLNEWDVPNALAIKYLNGLNSTNNTWLESGGQSISFVDCHDFQIPEIMSSLEHELRLLCGYIERKTRY